MMESNSNKTIAEMQLEKNEIFGKSPKIEIKRISDELLDIADLMQFFKVSRRTLFNWKRRAILPFIEVGGKLYVIREELYAALHRNTKLGRGVHHE